MQTPPQQPPPPQGNWGGRQNDPPRQFPQDQGQRPQQGWQPQPPPSGHGGEWQGYEPPPPPERNWVLIGGVVGGAVFCLLAVVTLICVLTLTSGGDSDDPTPVVQASLPTVTISQPTAGQTFSVGDTITVQAQASDTGSGITRVELLVNNVVVDSQTSENPLGESSLTVLLDYTAAVPVQNQNLVVRAYRGVVRSEDAAVAINVGGNTTTGNATQTTNNNNQTTDNTNNQNAIPPTFNPLCRARVDVGTLNLRAGPSTDYDILGRLTLGTEVPLVGRLGDNSWWQVSSGSTRGWVSASFTTLLGTCNNIAVTTPPASPTPLPTNTPEAAPEANLTVSTLAGSQSIVLTGGEVAASYILRVKNIGNSDAGAFNVTITYPDGEFFDYTVDALAAGEEVDIPNISASYSAVGTYRLSVLVDSSGNITESDKNDNTAFLDINVVEPTPTPEGE